MKTIKLTNCEIKLVDSLTWGQYQDIEDVIMTGIEVDNAGLKKISPTIMREQKYKLLEICINEIKEGEEIKTFSKEWMDNLSKNDGDELMKAVDEISKKK